MLATTAASRTALLSIPPQCSRRSRPTASASPASLSLSRASICRKNQRRDEAAQAAIKPMPMAKTRRPSTATTIVPMTPAMANVRQQPGDRWDVQPHQQKGGRRQQEINHRKQQDDSGEQSDVIWHPQPFFPLLSKVFWWHSQQ